MIAWEMCKARVSEPSWLGERAVHHGFVVFVAGISLLGVCGYSSTGSPRQPEPGASGSTGTGRRSRSPSITACCVSQAEDLRPDLRDSEPVELHELADLAPARAIPALLRCFARRTSAKACAPD
jgi:hypothetical protein